MGFRVLLFDRLGNPEGELSEDAGTLLTCTRSEELNAEHSLSLTTERHMEVGTRALTYHADGRWREWVVDEPEETHDTGTHAIGTYHLCWSLQYDLQTVFGSIRELGMATPATARQAMSAALDGTVRWTVGTIDVNTRAESVVMNNDESAWSRITTVVKRWGGEVDAEIIVDDFGVKSRKVALRKHLGSEVANRRFEWSHDLTTITRTPDPGPYVCRIIPQGSDETEEAADGYTTYGVALEIESQGYYYDESTGIRHDSGSRYLRDVESEEVFKVSDGRGGFEYPTTVVNYSTDDVDDLFAYAKEDILGHTRPSISYSGTATDFAVAGLDVDGIELGEEVQIIDLGFNEDAPLRVQERVVSMSIEEVGAKEAQLNIGKFKPSLERNLATVIETIGVDEIALNLPTWDPSMFDLQLEDLGLYEVEQIEDEPLVIPVQDFPMPDYSSLLENLDNRITSIEGGLGLTQLDTADGYPVDWSEVGSSSSSVDGGSTGIIDSVEHRLNGVRFTTGVVNFTTVTTSGSSGSSGSGSSSSTSEDNPFANDTSGKVTGWGATVNYEGLWNNLAGSSGVGYKFKKSTATTWGDS